MIRLNCFFEAKRGKYNQALEAAIALTCASQLHEGCVAYDVFESGTRKDIFMICETWASEDALAAHSQTEDFKRYVAVLEQCGTIKIEKFEK